MDPSIFKLLEEEEDEDESTLSKDDVDAFQASMLLEIEGGNHSSSQPVGSITTEPESPQKVSSQRTHGVEQPVVAVNFGPTESKEITKERFLRQVRKTVGNRTTELAMSKQPQFKQVNFSAPSGTIPAGSIVRKTPKMPCVGQKKPLEAQGSSLPPSSKRQRLRGTSFARSDEKFNDVTELSGINHMEEKRKLLSSLPKKDSRDFNSVRRGVHEEKGRTILQKVPLQRKLKEIMAKSGIKHIKDDVERCLSLCVEERMRKLLCNIIRMSKQRTDPEKYKHLICITSEIRKQINDMNQKAKEEWEKKHGGKEKLKNEENDIAKEYNRSEQVKAANAHALASIGGDNAFSKWKLMAEARRKPSSVLGSKSKNLSGETAGERFGKYHGSPKVVRSISVKDVIAVLEKEPQMSRSTLFYRLINMICSDVPTQQEKT